MRKSHFTKSVTIYLKPETLSQINKISDREEISIGSLVRDLIDRSLSTTAQDQSVASSQHF